MARVLMQLLTQDSGELIFDGDLTRFDRIGWQMASGRIVIDGGAGHYVGGCMSAGELVVKGDAGLLAACEMAGGTLTVKLATALVTSLFHADRWDYRPTERRSAEFAAGTTTVWSCGGSGFRRTST